MSLYQRRKHKDGPLLSPFWYCEFLDRDLQGNVIRDHQGKPRLVRLATTVEVDERTPKTLAKSKEKARVDEARVMAEYVCCRSRESEVF